jgi:hypothetical protein
MEQKKEKNTKPIDVKGRDTEVFQNLKSNPLKDDIITKIEQFNIEKIKKQRDTFFTPKQFVVYQPKNWTDIGKYLNKWEVQKKKSKVFLIHMELNNGKHRQFTIVSEFGSFVYDNKRYLIDEECMYEDIDAKLWCLYYHESLCLPIKHQIPKNNLLREAENQADKIYDLLLNHEDARVRRAVAEIPKPDVVFAINPENLERFMISKVIEKVIKGGEMDDIFGFLKIMTIVNAVMGGITLLIVIIISFQGGK